VKLETALAVDARRSAQAAHSLERATRVEHIRKLMATGLEWSRQRAENLAVEWGVAYSTIRDYSAEAARISRHNRLDDVDEIRETSICRLERVILEAMTCNPPQLRVAVEASRELARIGGVVHAAPVQQVVFLDTNGRPTLPGENLMRGALRACAEGAAAFLLAHPGELDAAIAAGIEAGNAVAHGQLEGAEDVEVSTSGETAGEVALPSVVDAEDAEYEEAEGDHDGGYGSNGSNGSNGHG
jgi:hypothetical protein